MRDVRTIDLSNFKTAKKGKRFVCILIDYFLLVIFSFMMFSLADPIYENLSYTKNVKSQYEVKQNETIEILKSTYLEKYDESNYGFIKIEKDADNFILSLIKTSYYENEMTYYEKKDDKKVEVVIEKKDTLSYLEDGVYINCRISQYYLNFRTENKDLYKSELDILTRKDLNEKYLKLNGDNKDLIPENFDITDSFYLSKDNATKLSDYVNFNDDAGKNLYTRIKNLYVDVIDKGIIEVENNYQPYLDSLTEFKNNLYAYSRGFDLCLIISYLLSFIICYVIFPLCFKRGRTLSYRVNSLFPLRNDNVDLRASNYIIKYLLLFIEQFSCVFFLPLFISKLNVLSMPFVFNITLFQLIIFSFLFSILSIVFFFISKDNQTLSEFASNTYSVDITTSIEQKKVIKDMNSL